MFFKEVIGQESIKKQLIDNVRKERLAHAQLFYGREGYGGLPLAIAFAQYVSCENKQEFDSCGVCNSCIKYNKLAHPDLHFVFPVNTTQSVSKDPVSDDFIQQWRQFVLQNLYFTSGQWYEFIGVENKQGLISKNESQKLIQKLSFKSFEADYKTVIIWLPEKMNDSAANKILKLIEEPEGKTLFFMISEDPGQIISTILSRTQQIKIPGLKDQDLKKAIKEKFNLNEDELISVTNLANGDFINAMEIVNTSEQSENNLAKFTEWMRLCYKNDISGLINWVDEMHSAGREKQKSFLSYSLRMARENFTLSNKLKEVVYLNKAEFGFSENFHPYINRTNIEKIYSGLNKAYNDIEYNAYSKIVFLDTSLQFVKLIKR